MVRTDGTVAEFTIDDVQVFTRDRFDAHKAYGPRKDGRAELRLITCGGTFDRASHEYTANVVVSAYLTGEKKSAAKATEAVDKSAKSAGSAKSADSA